MLICEVNFPYFKPLPHPTVVRVLQQKGRWRERDQTVNNLRNNANHAIQQCDNVWTSALTMCRPVLITRIGTSSSLGLFVKFSQCKMQYTCPVHGTVVVVNGIEFIEIRLHQMKQSNSKCSILARETVQYQCRTKKPNKIISN
jgi:type III secretory pathway component EscT